MTNVLIRDVPSGDLEQIRSAASSRGMSLQAYLREAVQAQAAYVRRQEALTRAAARLRGGEDVTDNEREAALEAIAAAHAERAASLAPRPDQ